MTDIDIDELSIFTSKGSERISSNNYTGHTCTLFRGQVMCFGYNNFGQLGRENTSDFGAVSYTHLTLPTTPYV